MQDDESFCYSSSSKCLCSHSYLVVAVRVKARKTKSWKYSVRDTSRRRRRRAVKRSELLSCGRTLTVRPGWLAGWPASWLGRLLLSKRNSACVARNDARVSRRNDERRTSDRELFVSFHFIEFLCCMRSRLGRDCREEVKMKTTRMEWKKQRQRQGQTEKFFSDLHET